MIVEDFCSPEIVALLKEKGAFEQMDLRWKYDNGKKTYYITHQMALKWLRNVHKLHIEIMRNYDYSIDADNMLVDEWWNWSYRIISVETASLVYIPFYDDVFDTYEDTVEAAIKYVLEKLI